MLKEKHLDATFNLTLTVFQSGGISWITNNLIEHATPEAAIHPYIMIAMLILFIKLTRVDYIYGERLDDYTLRHLVWDITQVSVKFMYLVIGILPLSLFVACLMGLFTKALFYGPQEKPITWEELSNIIPTN